MPVSCSSPARLCLVATAHRGGLRLRLVAGSLEDRRDLGIGDEALPALVGPVEEHPDTVLLVRVAEDHRALGSMLLALLRALRREDLEEAVDILHRRRRQDHLFLLLDRGSGPNRSTSLP